MFFMLPIIKCRGHYVMTYASVALVSINIWFPSIRGQTPGSIDPSFLWLIWGEERKVPFDDQLCRSSKMAATAMILDLVSVDYRTNACVDWSKFSVAYLRWGEEGSFRWSALPLVQNGRYGHDLGFGFRRLEDKRLGRLIRFFCGSLGVTRGRFLAMISSVANPRWLLRPPSWISFPSIFWPTPWLTIPIFFVAH
jgi:hypothetical protein